VQKWEYMRATWDEVREFGPKGWRLIAVPPVQEVRQVLGQPQVGEPLYAMEREVGADRRTGMPADPLDAALARAATFQMAGMSHPGSLAAVAGDLSADRQREDGQPGPSGEAGP
jgi:hypothetical protein